MNYIKRFLLAILACSVNAKCGPGFGSCEKGRCCSKFGYCGSTDEYCGIGCQADYGHCNLTTEKNNIESNRCGPGYGTFSPNGLCGENNGICPNHQCCSKYGYCGSTDDYCGNGCQSEFGRCGEYKSDMDIAFKYYYQCNDPKHWALTFDDGPYEYDNDLLDLLEKKGIKATFFVNGDYVMDIKSEKAENIIKRMNKDGHIIASHTWTHFPLEFTSEEDIIVEMTKLEEVLMEYIGKKPALMRLPHGTGDGSDRLAIILNKLGYTAGCMWNVDTLDSFTNGDVNFALKSFKSSLGKPIISLNHCYYSDITKESLLNLVNEEIDYMLEQGYTPVTMDVCLGLDAYQN
ncbi:glycoside hydrolase/deacetylase [Anaeromyces robustus]|uniref:Glycoside hydrolase/deacetylase n=1 Tax=Anaeromyces robustus TaxID=1754192 RepID=A0A1Y1XCJ1_9FUNG|nr:glycoside hydrolase/deacetylase [Anaeromyces robustus]|eukprot:ORX83427.1 glycoside hydrolase/deacetylase [Anaeromyces robustus]